MHLGIGQETITPRGQLQLMPSHEACGIIHPKKPVRWGVSDDGVKALLSQHPRVINRRSASLCGTALLEADLVMAVPVPVFEFVEGIEPGIEVGFAASREMLEQEVMYMMEIDRFFEEFPNIQRGIPGKPF